MMEFDRVRWLQDKERFERRTGQNYDSSPGGRSNDLKLEPDLSAISSSKSYVICDAPKRKQSRFTRILQKIKRMLTQ